MNKRLRILVVLCLIFSVGLVACGGGGGGDNNTPAPSPNAKDFFPTSVGNSWTYRNAESLIALLPDIAITSGNNPQIRRNHSNGDYSITTYIWQDDALYLSKYEYFDKNDVLSPLFSPTYSPPALFFPSIIKDGVHETAHTSINGRDNTIDITVTAWGTETVAAGTFENCMLITQSRTFIDSITGNSATNTELRWVAPGVGIIKTTYIGIGTEELTTYSVK